MKAGAEFKEILDNLLKDKVEPPTQFTVGVAADFGSIEFTIKSFSGGVETKYKVIKKPVPEKQKKIEPVIVRPKTLRIKPLTYDQKRAVEFFIKLGEKINPDSCLEEIKTSYRVLAKKHHPDLNPSHSDQFKQISLAYKLLILGF